MAFIQMLVESKYLSVETHVDILIPDKPRTETIESYYVKERKFPVLYLLHGTYGSESSWVRRSRIEIYAKEHDCMVVMPSGLNSEFLNWHSFSTGLYFEDYIIKELMPMVQAWFPASGKREDNFIGGLSMGSCASVHLALAHPEKFAGAICLSGVPKNWEKDRKRLEELEGKDARTLAEIVMNTDGDLPPEAFDLRYHNNVTLYGGAEKFIQDSDWNLTDKADPSALPEFFFSVGEKDSLFLEPSREYQKKLEKLGIKASFFYDPAYGHEWRHWDKWLEKGLEHFLPRK